MKFKRARKDNNIKNENTNINCIILPTKSISNNLERNHKKHLQNN